MYKRLAPCRYTGERLRFLQEVDTILQASDITNPYLLRATEQCHLWKVEKYGTDRAGFPLPRKLWTGDPALATNTIYHEDVIIAMTREALIENESTARLPSLFNNFAIHSAPVLLIYEEAQFSHLVDYHYLFRAPQRKLDALLAILPVIPIIIDAAPLG